MNRNNFKWLEYKKRVLQKKRDIQGKTLKPCRNNKIRQ